MTTRQFIALVAGAAGTLAFLAVSLWLLVFGGYFPDNERLVFVSIALAPVAMAAAMVGYGVWWLAMFILSLFLGNRRFTEELNDQDSR
jgi:hypothetical protein